MGKHVRGKANLDEKAKSDSVHVNARKAAKNKTATRKVKAAHGTTDKAMEQKTVKVADQELSVVGKTSKVVKSRQMPDGAAQEQKKKMVEESKSRSEDWLSQRRDKINEAQQKHELASGEDKDKEKEKKQAKEDEQDQEED